MTTALISGSNSLLQNVKYATLGSARWCVSDTELEVATSLGGAYVAVPETVTGVILGGALFVRCPTGNAIVSLSDGAGLFPPSSSGEAQQVNVIWNTGATPVPFSGLALVNDISTASAVAEAYGFNAGVALTSALTTDVTGISGSVTVDDPGAVSGTAYGVQGYINNIGAGIIAAANAFWGGLTAAAAGITNGYIYYAGSNDATNKWSFYGEAGAGKAEILDGVQTGVVAVGSLPTPSADIQGLRMMVNNATVTTFASVVAAGGANIVPVYCDGTNWRIG